VYVLITRIICSVLPSWRIKMYINATVVVLLSCSYFILSTVCSQCVVVGQINDDNDDDETEMFESSLLVVSF